jgi:hypothetical protein
VNKFQPGDVVIVEFQGVECSGEVIKQSSTTGYVMAHVTIPDVEVDFGSISPCMDPQPTVCVPQSRVRLNSVAQPL